MKSRALAPWIIQVVGLILIVGQAIFWAATRQFEPVILGASGTLVFLGQGVTAYGDLKSKPDSTSSSESAEKNGGGH